MQQGYGHQQPPQPPVPQPKKSKLWLWLLLGVGGLLFTCGGLAAIGAALGGDSASAGPMQEVTQMPWIGLVQGNCDAYKAAPNDIKKSAIYNETIETLKGVSISGSQGKLTNLRTNQGGSMLDIGIDVGRASFKNKALFSTIKKGSPIYEAASNMTEGQCVIFSAEKVEPASVVERSKVCDLDYYVEFTELRACN